MSVKTCKQHANEPIFIYAQCAACEIQRYRNQVDELKAECARSTEREILQLAEIEALRKDADRYRWTCIEGNWVARFHGKWRAHIGEYGDKQPTDWYPSRGEAIDAALGLKVKP